ncbi:hypothetical protein SSZBM1_139 [Synechococcus phage S-SZBM1]|uniref:Uncharacterized protein n=1 Tax=Synechococcus phage S-SZBM1 TaxID=2926475 RepID=A0AC61TSR1_9CAUD|nr:hypothetical protein PP650_gp137 [Synechococcus phage S-SZBM1]UNH61256.1 hypothetical protein SSZBM1_139 [Synechococcus phage S-SZBM1]
MLDIKISAALLGYTEYEQRKILNCVTEGTAAPTARLQKAVDAVTEIYETHVDVIEGYAGFPIDKELITKNKGKFSDDRNIGRVISVGGNSLVITGKKADGRYQVVGKKGERTAKHPEDIGLNMQREHIDIEDLHQEMTEGLKQARKNVGMDPNKPSCWKGYKATGTKMKGGKEVPDCKKEGFDLESFIDFDDDEFDTLSFEELELIAEEALLELEEDVLTEALEIIGGMTLLSEDRYASAVATSKANAQKPEVKAGVRKLRKEKMKAALKTAATKVGEKAGSAAGTVAKGAQKAGSAVKSAASSTADAAKKAGSAVSGAAQKAGSAVSGAASKAASGAKRVGRAAGEAAGAATAGFRKGYADAMGHSRPKGGSSSGSRGSSGTMSSSEVGKKSSSDSGENRVRLRDRIKSGLKKAIRGVARGVGGAARSVARGARRVERRMNEQQTYSWRREMGVDE